MFPELFEVPFTHITVKSYGLMMVVGFLLGVLLMRHLSKKAGEDPFGPFRLPVRQTSCCPIYGNRDSRRGQGHSPRPEGHGRVKQAPTHPGKREKEAGAEE